MLLATEQPVYHGHNSSFCVSLVKVFRYVQHLHYDLFPLKFENFFCYTFLSSMFSYFSME